MSSSDGLDRPVAGLDEPRVAHPWRAAGRRQHAPDGAADEFFGDGYSQRGGLLLGQRVLLFVQAI